MIAHQTSLSELSINDTNILCQNYLTILYHDISLKNIPLGKDVCETYGEILYAGVDKILSLAKPSASDVFVDYGSGLGKVVIQVFLKSLVREAYGIEISPELNQQALNAAERLQNELPEFYKNERKLTFLLGSFLEVPLTTCTIAMMTSTCFTQELLNKLGE